jgi:hypothetical protein
VAGSALRAEKEDGNMDEEWSDACTFLMGRRAHCRGSDTVHVNADLSACFGNCGAEAQVRKRTKRKFDACT